MDEGIRKIILLMICLAVLGCILAGVLHVTIDLPLQQEALHAPKTVWLAHTIAISGGMGNIPKIFITKMSRPQLFFKSRRYLL